MLCWPIMENNEAVTLFSQQNIVETRWKRTRLVIYVSGDVQKRTLFCRLSILNVKIEFLKTDGLYKNFYETVLGETFSLHWKETKSSIHCRIIRRKFARNCFFVYLKFKRKLSRNFWEDIYRAQINVRYMHIAIFPLIVFLHDL